MFVFSYSILEIIVLQRRGWRRRSHSGKPALRYPSSPEQAIRQAIFRRQTRRGCRHRCCTLHWVLTAALSVRDACRQGQRRGLQQVQESNIPSHHYRASTPQLVHLLVIRYASQPVNQQRHALKRKPYSRIQCDICESTCFGCLNGSHCSVADTSEERRATDTVDHHRVHYWRTYAIQTTFMPMLHCFFAADEDRDTLGFLGYCSLVLHFTSTWTHYPPRNVPIRVDEITWLFCAFSSIACRVQATSTNTLISDC